MLGTHKKGPALCRASLHTRSRNSRLVSCGVDDQVVDSAMRFIDVMNGAIPQPARVRIIFFASYVIVRLVDQFQRLMVAPLVTEMSVDRHVVVNIFSVVDGSLLDFANGLVDLVNGAHLLVVLTVGRRDPFEMSTRIAQIAKRMQVMGMLPRFVRQTETGADGHQKHYHGKMSQGFHGFPFGMFVVSPNC